MMRLVIILTFLALGASAQVAPEPIVKVNVREAIVDAGSRSIINFQVEVKDEYHIQANKVQDDSLIPTKLELRTKNGFLIKSITFPPAKKFKLEGTETYLDVYDGKFEITALLETSNQLPKGKHMLEAKLSYQACNSNQCLFPRSVEFAVTVKVQ